MDDEDTSLDVLEIEEIKRIRQKISNMMNHKNYDFTHSLYLLQRKVLTLNQTKLDMIETERFDEINYISYLIYYAEQAILYFLYKNKVRL